MNNFSEERAVRIAKNATNTDLVRSAQAFLKESILPRYSYNFSWMNRPIIQYPQEIVALHEIIWETKPELIIETGVVHGGSLIFSASMLALLDLCEGIEQGKEIRPAYSRRKVLGIDIEIREPNRRAIEAHPMASRIQLIQGSSIVPDVIQQVAEIASGYSRILVCLDSNHTHQHVLEELRAYAPMVSKGSYCVVLDTVLEDLPKSLFPERPWGPGDNPKTAVHEFLKTNKHFVIDATVQNKLLITVAPDGYLKRVL